MNTLLSFDSRERLSGLCSHGADAAASMIISPAREAKIKGFVATEHRTSAAVPRASRCLSVPRCAEVSIYMSSIQIWVSITIAIR
jgi:hypothetical protein